MTMLPTGGRHGPVHGDENVPHLLGDLVTRDGTDIHIVIDPVDGGVFMTVRCVLAPISGWTDIDIDEHNWPWQYDRVTPERELAIRDPATRARWQAEFDADPETWFRRARP
jgi:hypothetical protein